MTDSGISLSQIELVSVILLEIERQLKDRGQDDCRVPMRVINAAIEAANIVVAEAAEKFRPAAEGIGLGAWLNSDETGLSSRYMAHVLADGPMVRYHYPHDPSDFGRCLGLLRAVPELREKLPQMRDRGKHWAALVDNWAELEQLYYQELPSGYCTKCFTRMIELLKDLKD